MCLCSDFIQTWLGLTLEIIQMAKVPEVSGGLFWGNLRSCYPRLSTPVTPSELETPMPITERKVCPLLCGHS